MFGFLTAAILANVAAATAVEPPATPEPTTPQALFDAASAAHDAGSAEEAVRLFTKVEQLNAMKRNPSALAAVQMRKGLDLIALDRFDEAEATLRSGLKLAPADHPELQGDRLLAERGLGDIDITRLHYASATVHYQQALALAEDDTNRANLHLSLASSTMFDPDDAALDHADKALAIATAQPAKTKEDKRVVAQLQTVRARALLNRGRFPEAYAVLRKAVADQGGLDLTVRYDEIATRSDLAITALLAGKDDDARKYMAYTGAGRIENTPFALAVGMALPQCGGPADLKLEDVAVVEFAIRADGSVVGARPIYSSARGPAAFEYAGAVLGWSWRPEAIAKVPDLFRAATRVELRCTTSAPRPPVMRLLDIALGDWLRQPAPAEIGKGDAAALAPLKAELASRRAAGDDRATIAVLTRLGSNAIAAPEDREQWLIEARDRAIKAGAPLAARTSIEIRLARADFRWDKLPRYRAALHDILARADVTADPVASGTLRLLIADTMAKSTLPPEAIALLREVGDDPRLSPGNPLRVGALMRLAAAQAASGDRNAAEASFRRTGLSEQQCALLDAPPKRLRDNATASDFPMEAARWGFEGWVRIEYDIGADGKTANQRAIVAYPPFVFRNAAIGIAKGLVYAQTYRPEGGAGCGAEQENVRFGDAATR